MQRIERDKIDFFDLLNEQVDFMIDACEQYDKGKFNASKLLATYIRTIVNNTRSSTSLLTHLEKQSTMKFYNTADTPKKAVYFLGMVFVAELAKPGPTLIPDFEPVFLPIFKPLELKSKKWLSFNTWWNQEVIISDELTFSRFEMIWFMANQDGGTHVDKGVVDKYYKISKATESMLYLSSDPIQINPNIKGEPYKFLHFAVVRQIAHELIISLDKEFQLGINYHPTNAHHLMRARSFSEVQNLSLVEGEKIEYLYT